MHGRQVIDKPNTKIVHMTSVHQPDDVRVFVKECCTLVKAGYPVYLIAPAYQDEIINGVHLLAVGRARSKFTRLFKTVFEVYRKAIESGGDIFHFHDPELIPIGLLLKLGGKKVVYDVHEDVPLQILSKSWISPILRKPLAKIASIIERVGSKYFDRIVVATPTIAKNFPQYKCVLVQNYPIISELILEVDSNYLSREPNVVYAGGITRIRGIVELVDAVMVANKEINVNLVIAGKVQDSTLDEQDIALMKESDSVEWLGWINRKAIRELFGRCRAGMVTLHPAPNYIDSQPIKLFEYMSAGLPVIASDFPLWRKIIEDCNCGLLVNPLDSNDIAEAVAWIINHPLESERMGIRGRNAVREKYSWESQATNLITMYEELVQ